MADILSKATQENVITLLCFDSDNCKFIKSIVPLELFDPPYYRNIAKKAYAYIDHYNEAPKEHIADELEDYLLSDKEDRYKDILNNMFIAWSQGLNSKYVVEKLIDFIDGQKFIHALIESANLQKGGKLKEAKQLMRESLDFKFKSFDDGLGLKDFRKVLNSNEDDSDIVIPTGIKELDFNGVGLNRKQLTILQAAVRKGKSTASVSFGKKAVLAGFKVCHISLEIVKEIVLQRYIQSICGLTQRQYSEAIRSPMFVRDGNGDINGIEMVTIDRGALTDENIGDEIEEQLVRFNKKIDNLVIIDFPSRSKTPHDIEAYLDYLEKSKNFIPDLLIVDYILMLQIDPKNFRIDLGDKSLQLRKMASERNMAVFSPVQANRQGIKQASLGTVGESFSLPQNADVFLTYNQTPSEEKSKIARLNVNTRAGKGNFTVLMLQNYDIMAYCLDSCMLPENYNFNQSFDIPPNEDGDSDE